MKFKAKIWILLLLLFFVLYIHARGNELHLSNKKLRIEWKYENGHWKLSDFSALKDGSFVPFGNFDGKYSILYSSDRPSKQPLALIENGDTLIFPERTFKYIFHKFQRGISEVPMNKAGVCETFYPQTACKEENEILFFSKTPFGDYFVKWTLSEDFDSDIHISVVFKPCKDGYYSLPSVNASSLNENEIAWCGVPGFFMGNKIQASLPLSYAYGHGLPEYPVICRESTISTMISFLRDQNGICLSVIPSPEHNRNPYERNEITHDKIWNIGLSHKNRDNEISPTAYHPILGENNSFLKNGDSICFNYSIRLKNEDWYDAYKHVIYNHYNFAEFLKYKQTELSLSDRILMLYDYILDEKKAMWNKEDYHGKIIAAQSYHGGVKGADKDAMKNSDIGTLWMLSKLTNEKTLSEELLPYIKNFKIEQQVKKGFFKGAVEGQYYLAKSKKFTEEWGNHFEPTAITYYTMMDLGNILLFENNHDKELKKYLRNGAERLLKWQKPDGSWDLAYDRTTHKKLYAELQDLRPTFYGQIVAYQLLKDQKYLESAIRGADWLIENGVEKLNFVGVCGDVRFVNDFATIQCSMALFDLYEITSDSKYLDAAIKTAKYYTTSFYTHPIPNAQIKTVKETDFRDWQLSQCGLGFEHGGVMGSAVDHGPILLANHCSYFIKLFSYTSDRLFLDLARTNALGRDAFVNPETGVASYYWTRFNQGTGPFPHHAIWQIGWIYDYLIAEAELRSEGKIAFPRGFMTPKVGSHKSLGFAQGEIDGMKVNLLIHRNLIQTNNPNIDYITSVSDDGKTLYVVLLNQQAKQNSGKIKVNGLDDAAEKWIDFDISDFGIQVIKIGI
jgi:hypothetical protein